MKTELEIRYAPPGELAPDAGNPRRIGKAERQRLAATLDRFGFVEPLVYNVRNGELVSGHQRRQIAIDAGAELVPVVDVDLPEAEARALGLALNNPDTQGAWDTELLALRLDELRGFDVDELAGFDPSTLEALGIAAPAEPETEEVAFKATRGRDPKPSPVPEEPETEPGDVWALGDHLVVCADSFTLDVRALIEGAADMLATDPPYAIFGSSTGVSSDVTDDRMVRPFFRAVARIGARSLNPHGHAYVHCDWRSWSALWEGFRSGGLAIRNMLVWDKNGAGLGSNYANTHELVAFAHYVPKHSNTFDNRRNEDYRPVYASNVFHENRPQGADRLHNAAKPVPLLERFIENSTEPGGVVLDPFAGSGSTLIAAENIGRRAVVIDHEPGWCDVIVARWRELTGKRGRRLRGRAAGFVLPETEAVIHAAPDEEAADELDPADDAT